MAYLSLIPLRFIDGIMEACQRAEDLRGQFHNGGCTHAQEMSVKASLVDNGRYNSDPTYRAAADAAHRAIMNPRCGQWALPPAKYESWRKMRLDINPQD